MTIADTALSGDERAAVTGWRRVVRRDWQTATSLVRRRSTKRGDPL